MEQEPSSPAARNRFQLALAERFFGFASDETSGRWIEEHAAAFANLLAERPGLLGRFSSEPAEALEEAERALYATEPKPTDAE